MKRIALSVFLSVFCGNLSSASPMKTLEKTSTSAGALYLESGDDLMRERYFVLNGRVIKKSEGVIVHIKKKFILPHSTVLIVSEDLGGSGTIPEYYFLEIFPDGKTHYSKGFYSDDYTFRPRIIGKDVIAVDLGYSKGRRKIVYYKNGHMSYSLKNLSTGLMEEECKSLFEIYRDYVNRGKCIKDIIMTFPNSTFHTYDAIAQNPSFDSDLFESTLVRDCRRRYLRSYRKFSQRFCR